MRMIAGLPIDEYRARVYREGRARLIAVLGDACVRCGSTERLEFDHIDPSTKSFNIKHSMYPDDPEVYAELMKCQLLCRECHFDKTRGDIAVTRPFTHGTWYAWARKKCECPECDEAKHTHYEKRKAARRAARSA